MVKHDADAIVFGGLAGCVGNIFKEVLIWGFYFSGLIHYGFVHFCVGLVVNPAVYVKDSLAIVVGIMIDFTIAAFFSIAMYLIMRRIGTDYWLLKGLGFGMMVFLLCFGILRPSFSIRIETTPLQALLYMIPNLAYGVVTCWLIKRHGSAKIA